METLLCITLVMEDWWNAVCSVWLKDLVDQQSLVAVVMIKVVVAAVVVMWVLLKAVVVVVVFVIK